MQFMEEKCHDEFSKVVENGHVPKILITTNRFNSTVSYLQMFLYFLIYYTILLMS